MGAPLLPGEVVLLVVEVGMVLGEVGERATVCAAVHLRSALKVHAAHTAAEGAAIFEFEAGPIPDAKIVNRRRNRAAAQIRLSHCGVRQNRASRGL